MYIAFKRTFRSHKLALSLRRQLVAEIRYNMQRTTTISYKQEIHIFTTSGVTKWGGQAKRQAGSCPRAQQAQNSLIKIFYD